MEPERARRIIKAVLENVQNWEDRIEGIAEGCPAGSKHEALSLLRDMKFAKLSLERLSGITENATGRQGAEDTPLDPDQG